jgi:enterochelin esterase family protein
MKGKLMLRRALSVALLLCLTARAQAADDYKLGPDSERQEGVPKGRVERFEWKSTTFPGTVRNCAVYIPSQYDGKRPACVMVFQDGSGYVNEKGAWRVPIVFDNLIHRKEMPVTVGIFLDPGNDPVKNPPAKPGDPKPEVKPGDKPPRRPGPTNRSFEYDTLSDQYSKFLLDEILPEVTKRYDLKLTSDPEGRAISGSSSGGICAFTAAWQHPDQFRKVVSFIGSFTNIRGGGKYPDLVRAADKKPIRVFLQDGSNDLDNANGNWPLANQQMARSLDFADYDYAFVFGQGFHSGKHGQAILPDSLRWLWRDYKPE